MSSEKGPIITSIFITKQSTKSRANNCALLMESSTKLV